MKYRLDDGQIEVVDEAVAVILRRMTPAQRIALMVDCNETMRAAIAGQIRSRHPDWRDDQVLSAVARRMLGEST
jgi:hypothetical protein